MRGWAALAGVVLAAGAVAAAHSATRRPSDDEPPSVDDRGDGLYYRALLFRERGQPFAAYAIGRLLASRGGAAGERGRELLGEAPPRTVTVSLGPERANLRRGQLRFDEEGMLEVVGTRMRAVFDPNGGEEIELVHKAVRDPSAPGEWRVTDRWNELWQRDRARQALERPRWSVHDNGRILHVYDGDDSVRAILAPHYVRHAAISPDGTVVCAGLQDGRVLLQRGDEEPLLTRLGRVTLLEVVPNVEGRDTRPRFLVGTERGVLSELSIREPDDPRPYGTRFGEEPPPVNADDHRSGGPAIRWAGMADGRLVVVDDGGITVWNEEDRLLGPHVGPTTVERRILRWATEPQVHAVDLHDDHVAVLRGDAIHVVELELGLPVCPIPPLEGSLRRGVAAAKNGRVAIRSGARVIVCDIEAPGDPVATIEAPESDPFQSDVELSADGSRLLVRSRQAVRIYDVDSGERIGSTSNRWRTALSHDGSAMLGEDGVMTIEGDPVDTECRAIAAELGDQLLSVVDGRLIACDFDDEGAVRFRSERYEGLGTRAGASHDRRHLWVSSEDGSVLVMSADGAHTWRVHAGEAGDATAHVANGGGYVMTTSSSGRRRLFVLKERGASERVLQLDPPPVIFDGPGIAPETFTGDGEYYVRVAGVGPGAQTVYVSATGEELPATEPPSFDPEVRGVAHPFGDGPTFVGSSSHGIGVFRIGDSGPTPIALTPPGNVVEAGGGRWLARADRMVRVFPVGRDGPDLAELTAALTNHRVCPDDLAVVAVPTSAIDHTVWAPDSYCE